MDLKMYGKCSRIHLDHSGVQAPITGLRIHTITALIENYVLKSSLLASWKEVPESTRKILLFCFTKLCIYGFRPAKNITRSSIPRYEIRQWRSLTRIRVESFIGCSLVFNLRAQVSTNQKHYSNLHNATSSEWNFLGWTPRASWMNIHKESLN